MARCLALKQIQKHINNSASLLALYIKDALEQWTPTAEELPSQIAPLTAAVSQLVSTALQQAPWPMQPDDLKQVVWLQKHLPGISMAMRECLSCQLDIFTKRIGILQALANNKPPEEAQLLAQLDVEYSTYMKMEVLASVVFAVLPVAALCVELTRSAKARRDSTHVQHGCSQQQHRLRQGSQLISTVGYSINQAANIQQQLCEQKEEICDSLVQLGVEVWGGGGDRAIFPKVIRGQQLLSKLSMVWLDLVSELPPGHKDLMLFVNHIHWAELDVHFLSEASMNDMLKGLLIQLGATTKLYEHLKGTRPHVLSSLWLYIGLTADGQLAATAPAPAPAAACELPQHVLQDTELGSQQDAFDQHHIRVANSPPSGSCDSTTSSSRMGGVEGMGLAAEGEPGRSTIAQGDEDTNDMQALLRMMYGCTTKEGQGKA